MRYDYLIVGAGPFGATAAHQALKKGKRCLVIDKRDHIAGNCYTKNIDGINVHCHGPHIFHTSNKKVWDFVNSHVEFNHYIYTPKSYYKGKLYSLPFNMNTFYELWGVITPAEARAMVDLQRKEFAVDSPANLEEQAINLVGVDVYNMLIKGYSEKQWGRPAVDIPAFIINRLPLRFTYNNNYFNDRYQGIPIGGYTKLFERLLEGVEVKLGTDYFENREYFDSIADKVIFTGKIDEFYNFRFGELEYRGLKFEQERLEVEDYQGMAVLNYTDSTPNYTRVIEHKHFEFGNQPFTIVTKEYPLASTRGVEPYYPINDKRNQEIYLKYKDLANSEQNVIFGGRLAEYKYYDMHQIFENALALNL